MAIAKTSVFLPSEYVLLAQGKHPYEHLDRVHSRSRWGDRALRSELSGHTAVSRSVTSECFLPGEQNAPKLASHILNQNLSFQRGSEAAEKTHKMLAHKALSSHPGHWSSKSGIRTKIMFLGF